MFREFQIWFSYKNLVVWRILVYKRILMNPYLSRFSKHCLSILSIIFKTIVCVTNANQGRTSIYMDGWMKQTSALFSPQVSSLSNYMSSSTEALIALNSADYSGKGKVVFFSHGAYLVQNVSCVLIDMAKKSNNSYVNVLIYRRDIYPHVEEWWKEYALCFGINIEIVHEDSLLLVDRAKYLLENDEIVMCAPDFFFSEGGDYEKTWNRFDKTAKLFMRMAKQFKSSVYYINCCNVAAYEDYQSFLNPVNSYDSSEICSLFQDEIDRFPENWFFSYNHFSSIKPWREHGIK